MKRIVKQLYCLIFVITVEGFKLPGSCTPGQYYDSDLMECQECPANVSMVTSPDGFGCTCDGNSVPVGVGRCRPCDVTRVVSADGGACVSRRCRAGGAGGGTVCRKCPDDYISVTQNFDGSPMKEVLCVKCARGYRGEGNVCVRCGACACAGGQVAVRGQCVPKRFVTDRPKHEATRLHPTQLLDIVKHEYLCTQNEFRSCRALARACVRSLHAPDPAGPCRLWVLTKLQQPKGLPRLTADSTASDRHPGDITLSRGMNELVLGVASHTSAGGVRVLLDPPVGHGAPCLLPLKLIVGNDFSRECRMNLSQQWDPMYTNDTLAPFLYINGDLKPMPVSTRTPDGNYVQKGAWPSAQFKRYFLINSFLSTTSNVTNTVYLRTLLIRLLIERDKYKSSSLRVRISMEAQYATKSPLSQSITMSLKVEHEMPSAGVLRGLEIWCGVLVTVLCLYGAAQGRGAVRRGGLYISVVPLLAGALSDALHFAALFSTLHALAAEAGTLGMTLPLSRSEEHTIKAFVYSAVCLKAVRVAWLNWNQCRCDIFFLDWSEYNPPHKETVTVDKCNKWRAAALAREWGAMQARRRAAPAYTGTIAIIILHLARPWQPYVPHSPGSQWAVATLTWWTSYTTVLAARWTLDRVAGPPTAALPEVCTGVGLSLLVFQEEYYAHYVHGRSDSPDARTLSGPLAACRLVCAPQLRAVYKKLSTPGLVVLGESERDTKQALLSRFLAAFFERALDGLSWVASERALLERLLDVELAPSPREGGGGGGTSALLYDPDGNTCSCFSLTWWGEEWTLCTFDAMVFGCAFIVTLDPLAAHLVTLVVWQVMKTFRTWFGNKNLRRQAL